MRKPAGLKATEFQPRTRANRSVKSSKGDVEQAMKLFKIPPMRTETARLRKLVGAMMRVLRIGAPRKWTPRTRAALKWAIDAEVLASRRSRKAVFAEFIADPFWRALCRGKTGDALRQQYEEADEQEVAKFAADRLKMIARCGLGPFPEDMEK